MYSVNNISIQFSGNWLFEEVSFLINHRDRIGLVGKNGAGKTTLLNVISKQMEPESGDVVLPANRSIGYLPQEMEISGSGNVYEEALSAFEEAITLEKRISHITEELESSTDFHDTRYTGMLEELNRANERYQMIGGYAKEAETEKVLQGLGFSPTDFRRPLKEFSGGWQMRVELAKILLTKPDLLLLDEPTNHLDIEAIQWLEGFLNNYPGAVVLVSHDRALLDNITNRTLEIMLGKVYDYKVSYSEYVIQREEQRENQIATFNNQQREIARIERFIERFRYKNTKASQVQSRVKMLDRMDTIEVEDVDKSTIHFGFPPAPRSGKVVFEADGMSKSYGNLNVLKNIDVALIRNDAIAFVGKNGEGKTTMARIIIGELDYTGKAITGSNVKIGYFAQNQAELLDPDKTVFETIDDVAVGDMRTRVRGLLGSFLFSGDDIYKKVKVLSGGEKSRLAIARLLLTPVNLLVLDEPTNHLDMRSKDILKNALLNYDGTLIIVSHDRDFLQGLTNRVIEFRNRGIRQYQGDIYDFLESRKLAHLRDLESSRPGKDRERANNGESDNKIRYQRKKKYEKELRKLTNQINSVEKGISAYEEELALLDKMVSEPGKY